MNPKSTGVRAEAGFKAIFLDDVEVDGAGIERSVELAHAIAG
jgi:hypothetical protein